MSALARSNAARYTRLATLAARCGLALAAARYETLAARWEELT